jgi:FtsP/CotA-like multicopper oxidase with cupredoxin domain
MTYFDIRIPGLKMTVVAADGQYVNPVTVDEFRIALPKPMMSLWSLRVRPIPSSHNPWTGPVTLEGHWPRERVKLLFPPLDPRPLLTMEDMGMGGMGHDKEWTTARWEAWITQRRDDVYGRC